LATRAKPGATGRVTLAPMKIRRFVGPVLFAASVVINVGFGCVFGVYAKNHGGWAYVREHLHAGPPVTAMKIAPTNERREMLRLVPKVPGQILFMGDSLTQGGPWTDFFPGLPVQNRGIGGSTVRDGINLVHDGVVSGKPAKVFLQYGVNDFGAGTSVDGFIAEYTELVDDIRKASPGTKIYIQSIIPAVLVKGDVADADICRTIDDRLAKFAAERGCTYIDLYSHLALDPDTALPARMGVDRIHISFEAYKIWIDVVRPYVEEGTTTRPVN
jgi:lysophospholipase L1-like esterase